MTVQKLIEVFEGYKDFLHEKGISPVQFSQTLYDLKNPDPIHVKRHLAWAVREQLSILRTESPLTLPSIMKAMRWLGYVQGELRGMTYFSVSELREHSRSVPVADLNPSDPVLEAINGV